MTPTCEVFVDLRREPRIEGKLVTPVNCAYLGCTEAMLGGIVVAFMDRDESNAARSAPAARHFCPG